MSARGDDFHEHLAAFGRGLRNGIIEALEAEEGDRGLSWLPFFHDMGLITVLFGLSTPLAVMAMAVLAEFQGSRWMAVLLSGDGEPYADNLLRFYRLRLAPEEMPSR